MSIACCFAGTIFLSTLKSGSYHLEEKVSFFLQQLKIIYQGQIIFHKNPCHHSTSKRLLKKARGKIVIANPPMFVGDMPNESSKESFTVNLACYCTNTNMCLDHIIWIVCAAHFSLHTRSIKGICYSSNFIPPILPLYSFSTTMYYYHSNIPLAPSTHSSQQSSQFFQGG